MWWCLFRAGEVTLHLPFLIALPAPIVHHLILDTRFLAPPPLTALSMDRRFRNLKPLQVDDPVDDGVPAEMQPAAANGRDQEDGEGKEAAPVAGLFAGMKIRRRASLYGTCNGDYIGVSSDPFLTKMLSKQGDKKVLFADKVLKFTGTGKMKRRILVITDFAIYLVDPVTDALKRRIALAAVEKICLSKLSDNFFSIIVPTEYDCLMASTRKKEIANMLVKAMMSTSEYELEVGYSNRFEYNAAADVVKEVEFEEVEGGTRTRITKIDSQ